MLFFTEENDEFFIFSEGKRNGKGMAICKLCLGEEVGTKTFNLNRHFESKTHKENVKKYEEKPTLYPFMALSLIQPDKYNYAFFKEEIFKTGLAECK